MSSTQYTSATNIVAESLRFIDTTAEDSNPILSYWEVGIVVVIFGAILWVRSKASHHTVQKRAAAKFDVVKVDASKRKGEQQVEEREPESLWDFKVHLQQCSSTGDWRKALQLMRRAQEIGLRPDTAMYTAVVSTCSKAGEKRKSLALLQKMRREGLQLDELCLQLESEASADCATGSSISTVGDSPTQKPRQDSMRKPQHERVHTLTKAGRYKEAVELLYDLWERGCQPNHIDCHSALDACAKMRDGNKALAILEEMVKKNVEPDPPCYSAAISACAKDSRHSMWQRAIELLPDMKQRNLQPSVACYSAAIIACAEGRQRDLAMDLLGQLRMDGLRPDIITFNATINACAKTGSWEQAIDVLGQMATEGVCPTLISYSAGIHACAKAGTSATAYVAQELMHRAASDGLTPDVLMYNQSMDACVKCGQWPKALELLKEMTSKSIKATAITHFTAIKACVAGELVDETFRRIGQMREDGFELDANCCDTVNRMLSKTGQWEKALQIQALRRKNSPDSKGSTSQSSHLHALNACGKSGQWENALKLLVDMQEQDRKPNQSCVNALLVACSNSKMKDAWMKSLEFLCEFKGSVGLGGYNAAINALARSAQWEPALEILRSMKETSKITYNTAMNACAKGRQWERAIELMNEMRGLNFQPDKITYNSALDATAKCGQWQLTHSLYKKMQAEGVNADIIGATVTIHACSKAGQWQDALDVLHTARKNGLQIEVPAEAAIARAMIKGIQDAPEKESGILNTIRAHGLEAAMAALSSARGSDFSRNN